MMILTTWRNDLRTNLPAINKKIDKNNQYIVYSASGTFESYINKLFRIDVNTGEVVALLDPYIFDFPAEPSWRP